MIDNTQGPGPLTPKQERWQKRADKRFEKSSARQLAKNILHGEIKEDAMVTKSFGPRPIDTLRVKVKGQIGDIDKKEANRTTARKKVTHAFQRVKNKLLAGEFKNNRQMLELAKAQLPKKKVVAEPEKPTEPERKEEPAAPPEKPAEVVKVIKTTITEKQKRIKSINKYAFKEDVDVKAVLKSEGTSLIKQTGTEGEYEVHYHKKGNIWVKGTLTVVDSGQMFLKFGKESPSSIDGVPSLLKRIAGHNPGHLMGIPREEGGPNRKFKINK